MFAGSGLSFLKQTFQKCAELLEKVAQDGPERTLILRAAVVGVLQGSDRRNHARLGVRSFVVGRLILQELRERRIGRDGHGVVVGKDDAQIVDAVREIGVIEILDKHVVSGNSAVDASILQSAERYCALPFWTAARR